MRFGFGFSSRSDVVVTSVPKAPRTTGGLTVVPVKAAFRAAPAALVKRVPFEPAGRVTPVFFLHIPRTSGASFMSFLRGIFGPDQVTEGTEEMAATILGGRHETVRTDCLTGGLPLMRWQMYRGSDAYARVTILRDGRWISTTPRGELTPAAAIRFAIAPPPTPAPMMTTS